MPDRISRILSRHADLFRQGRLEEMLEHYVHPLAFFVGGQIRARQHESETVSALFWQRAEALKIGMERVTWDIVERGPDSLTRIPAIVDWNVLNASGEEVAKIRVRYFFEEQADGRLLIVMVEHLAGDLILAAQEAQSRTKKH